MSRTVSFLPAARLEVIEAYDWYETRALGLGAAFQSELDHQAARVADNPFQFPALLVDIRRARMRRFPYSLYFRLVDEDVFVLACFHASRDPRVWQDRI